MGVIVNTKSLCVFPFTTPTGANATSADECTVRYGDFLGPGHLILQVLLILVATFGLLVFSYRLWKLYTFCKAKNMSYRRHVLFVHFALCWCFNACLLIASIDVFGYWGILPIEVYFALDELCVLFSVTNGVLIVRFFNRMAKGMIDSNERRAKVIANVTIVALWVNYIGFDTAIAVQNNMFKFYDGLKTLFTAVILNTFLVAASVYAYQLLQIMKNAMAINLNKKHMEVQIRVLKMKYFRFFFVVSAGALATYVAGTLSLTASDYDWTAVVYEIPDPAQVAIRIIYILNVFMTVLMFKVPNLHSGTSSENNQTGVNSASTGKGDKNQVVVLPSPDQYQADNNPASTASTQN